MKNKQSNISTIGLVSSFAESFFRNMPEISDMERRRVEFILNFAKFLIMDGFTFTGSYNTDDQMLVFSSSISESKPIRISLRYEMGLQPICYWVNPVTGRANHYFSDLNLNSPNDRYERTLADFNKK